MDRDRASNSVLIPASPERERDLSPIRFCNTVSMGLRRASSPASSRPRPGVIMAGVGRTALLWTIATDAVLHIMSA